MTWARIDDHFDEHPKLAPIGPLGWGVWLAGLAYCNRNLTDGFIPQEKADSLGGKWQYRVTQPDGTVKTFRLTLTCGRKTIDLDTDFVIELLIKSGLWVRVPDGFLIHDYADFQPLKAEVMAKRELKKASGSLGGQQKAANRAASKPLAPASQTASTVPSKPLANGYQNSTPFPYPLPNHKQEQPQQDQQDVEPPAAEAPPTPAAPPARPLPDSRPAEVYDFWITTMGKSGVALKKTTAVGKKRIAAVKARLGDGYTVDQIKAAVTACAASEFHNGGNESGQSYNDLTLICRADKIDKFLDRKNGTPTSGERPKFNGAHQPSRPGPYRSPLPVAQPEEVPEGEI